ncbi:hypothetical protein CC2G_004356 [Coprinopsis cinerea AmutBmut pab1-1]|nr:hypothetical protein CC2G_004356 [Coprinopsis cinerea AmutBmut pab1-1]
MPSQGSSIFLSAQSSLQNSPPSPEIPADSLDIDVVDLEALNVALQIETRMDYWSSWVTQIAEFRRSVNCGSPQCAQGCTPLDDFMSCEGCVSDRNSNPKNCGLRVQFLRELLRTRGGLTHRQVEEFIPVYTLFKQTTLDAARDQLHHIKQSLAPVPHEARSPMRSLEKTLLRARKENARIVCESVRSRQRWMVLSRLLEDALHKCYDDSEDPAAALVNVAAELKRAQRLSLFYDPDDVEEYEEAYDWL